MLYQVIVAIILIVFAINLIFNLRALKRAVPDMKLTKPEPFVSILIPARNEEKNIEKCLKSLQNQQYPTFELLVLNDNSTDKTSEIVTKISESDNRIKLIEGEPLPSGWAGKPWACLQLAQKAKGDWLLFLDADTICKPEMLKSVMHIALEHKPSLLSGFPHQITAGLPQKIVIPLIYFIILWLPLWWILQAPNPVPCLAIGQFLLFPKEVYWKIGGHYAVKSRIMEDVWMSYEISRHGGRHLTIDLSQVVSCNMYGSIGAMWEGFKKWMYSVSTISPILIIILLVFAYGLFLAPFVLLWHDLFIASVKSDWQLLLILQVLIILFMRILVDHYFKATVISAFFHPVAFSYLIVTVIYTLFEQIIGKGVRWKDRVYGHKSGIN